MLIKVWLLGLGVGEVLATVGTPGRKGLHENESITEKIEHNINTFEPLDAALPEVLSI